MITNQKNNIKEFTAFAILKYLSSFPPLPPGPKECKHYILFDFNVLILCFKQTLIHICTATFQDCEVRQDFHICGITC